MATKKKLLQAAAGSAGGAGGLNVEDVFSTYLYEGNGGAQVIDNGINLGQSYGSGGVKFDGVDDYMSVPASTDFEFGTGDFTVEAWVNTDYSDYFNIWQNSPVTGGAGPSNYFIGVGTDGSVEFSLHAGGGGFSTSAGAVSQVTWAHVAIVRNSGTTYIYVDGVQQTSSAFFSGYNFNVSSVHTIGYRVTPNYASGYMADLRVVKGTAVYTSNFTAPTSPLTAITNTVLLTCQGDGPFVDNSSSSHTVTVDGAKASTFGPFDAADAGEGGLVWIKNREQTDDHYLGDSERGFSRRLETNNTNAETNNANGAWSLNASGFSVPNFSQVNTNGEDYTSWTFRKAPKFFDVVTYTGDGTSGRAISHNLGTTVGAVIVKRRDGAGQNWSVFHRSLTSGYRLLLQDTSGEGSSSTQSVTAVSSTTFTVGSGGDVNASGGTYVAYLFAHNDGDGDFGPDGDADIIKCGSYTGDGTTDGSNEVNLGFEPQWVLVKSSSHSENWTLIDNMRGMTTGGLDPRLFPNLNLEEYNTQNGIRALPNGFALESQSGLNNNGYTYIYIAIRRGPMAVPEDATDVFAPLYHAPDSGGVTVSGGFTTDFVLTKNTALTGNWWSANRLTGNASWNKTNTGDPSTDYSTLTAFDQQEGVYYNGFFTSGTPYDWQWKRAPNYFDVVAYTGNGTLGHAISHNLGVAPEMMWVKRRDGSQNWLVYHKDVGAGYYGVLSGNNVFDPSNNAWNSTVPTDTNFTVGLFSNVNASGGKYIAYLFASLDGVSKVGSFTHTYGSDTTVDCGFSSGARFVIVKRSSDTGDWLVFDTERGIVSGNDARLHLNDTSAEATSADNIDPNSSGFVFTGANGGGTYIFYAIA